MTKLSMRRLFGAIAACATAAASHAATAEYNFDSDPAAAMSIRTTIENNEVLATTPPGKWFPTGGSTLQSGADPASNGYLALTQTSPTAPVHGMSAIVVLNEIDPGQTVSAFTFAMDVRVGAGSAAPATASVSASRARAILRSPDQPLAPARITAPPAARRKAQPPVSP